MASWGPGFSGAATMAVSSVGEALFKPVRYLTGTPFIKPISYFAVLGCLKYFMMHLGVL